MEDFKELTCTLCLNSIVGKNFELIEDVTKYMLNVVQVTLNIDDMQKNMMCGSCSVKLYAAFDFKSACISANDSIVCYDNLEKAFPVDLREIYTKEQGISLTDDQKICRLCIQPTREGFVSIHEMEADIFQRYIPEMDFKVTRDPIICKFCLDTLVAHSTFIKTCSDPARNVENSHEEKLPDRKFGFLLDPNIKSEPREQEENNEVIDNRETELNFVKIKEERMEEVSIKTEDVEIKCGDVEEQSLSSQHSEIFIKSEVIKDNPTAENSLNTYDQNVNIFKCESCSFTTAFVFEIEQHILIHKDESEAVLYTPELDVNSQNQSEDSLKLLKHVCEICGFRTKVKRNLINHTLSHKDDSEVPWYKCNLCDHKSKWKYGLKNHMLIHKAASEIEWYYCDLCDHKSKDKHYLKRHITIIHKDASDIQWFACDVCEYKSKTKRQLQEHKLIHKDASEIQWHQCELCDYKSKTKRNLRAHMLMHRDVSETQRNRCDLCDQNYSTKYDLKEHMKIHKEPTELQLYRCHLCDHKTKTKSNLRKHLLIHKDDSEVQWHECELCVYRSKLKSNLTKHLLVHKRF